MYSDESGHNEREFNYPEEKTLNQLKKMKSKKINMLFTGKEVRMEKTVPEALSTARSRRLTAVLKTKGTVFSHTDLPPGK